MRQQPVVIIGGGIAGLAAGLDLAQNGVPTTILEVKDRFGGRIQTIRPNGFPLELGAEFVHGRSQPLLDAIRRAALSTQTVSDTNRTFENGQFRESNIWDTVGRVLNQVDLRKPDCSIEEFLAGGSFDEPTRDVVRHFITGFDAARTDRISAHARRRAEYAAEQINLDRQLRIAEGYGALVDYFVREIRAHGGRLLTKAKARRIKWERGKAEVMANCDGHEASFQANAAVITLPVGVLKSGEVLFEPSLPDKIEAANGLEFGNAVKLVFQFKEQAWEDFGFFHVPDTPIPTWWSDRRGPVLTGWAGGPTADALLGYSTDRLCAAGLEILARTIFNGAPVSALRERLTAMHYFNWAADPDIRGAYSYIPVNGLDLPKLLAAPVADTLFFAGEATVSDAQTGTVFAALETGQRAAREILGR